MDYQKLYDDFWQLSDQQDNHTFEDINILLNEIENLGHLGRILDIGCGKGGLVDSLTKCGYDVTGIDVSEVAIKYCRTHCAGNFLRGSILSLPFPDDSFDTIISTNCLEHLAEKDIHPAVCEVNRVVIRKVYLRIVTRLDRDKKSPLTRKPRRWWEIHFLESGLRKHPLCQEITPFEKLEHENRNITVVLQKIPTIALQNFTQLWRSEKRELHADMLRESNRRSDAHIARYQLARHLCPVQAHILDAACGLGYGTAILCNQRPKSKVTGVDISEDAINYCKNNYASTQPNLEFHISDVEYMNRKLPNSSFDFITSFETLEHLSNPDNLLRSIQLLLKPGGKFLCSVPNLWVDESGRDPNPWHLHVFDFNKLITLISKYLDVITLYAQIAGNGKRYSTYPRTLQKVQPKMKYMDIAAEWCLVLAMRRETRTKTIN